MVWIHGGGWQFGSAESHNGAALAKYGDVVIVALSYRSGFPRLFVRIEIEIYLETFHKCGSLWIFIR